VENLEEDNCKVLNCRMAKRGGRIGELRNKKQDNRVVKPKQLVLALRMKN
jgi:hypothetical protein